MHPRLSLIKPEGDAHRARAGSLCAAQALLHITNMKLGEAFLSRQLGAVLIACVAAVAASAFDLRVVVEIDKTQLSFPTHQKPSAQNLIIQIL